MKQKYKVIIITSLKLLLAGSMHAQWTAENVPTKENLNSIHLFNENSGWIVGDKGTMLYNYKDTWFKYPNITDENLCSVVLIDNNNGWAVGSHGTILKFNGTKWEKWASPTNEKLYSVSFTDESNGIAVGANGTVLLFDNGNWKLAKKFTRATLYSVSTKSDLSLVGGGLISVNVPVMAMQDNSENFVESFNNDGIVIKSIAIQNKNNVWAVGMLGTIFHFDGTKSARHEQFEKLPPLNSVFFSDEIHGMAVGYYGTIITHSKDGWTKNNSPVNIRLNGAAISGNKYYAVGNSGTVISLSREPDVSPEPWKTMDSAIKIGSYPNPSADVLNIMLPVENDQSAGLVTITNSHGQILYTEKISSSTYGLVYEVNTSELASGIYLINIKYSSGRIAAGKFIVRH